MKSILLASVSTVAFTGAAMAGAHSELNLGGDVVLGINREDEGGIYWDVDLDFGITADHAAMPDPDYFVSLMDDALEELKTAVAKTAGAKGDD